MTLDTLSIGCPLVQWRGEKGHCNWCDKELTGRQQRWCSAECSDAYGRNHWWSYASKAAKERDGNRCTSCGLPPTPFLEAKPPMPHGSDREAVNKWRRAVWDWYREEIHARRNRLEVHHVVAAEGKHSRASCVHHLDNLVTLCHPCHVEEERTKRERARNLAGHPALNLDVSA